MSLLCDSMSVPLTVREALALPVLAAGDPAVLTQQADLDRRLRWVHISELRDIGAMLSGDELVLTTGMGMAVSVEAAEDFVRQLIDVGAAGLVVELGAGFPSIPRSVLDLARRADFPVVALNRPVRFVDVTEAVHRAIVAGQLDELQFSARVHETFTALGLSRAPMASLLDAAAELSNSSVVLEDLTRRVLVSAARDEPVGRLLSDWERRSRLTPFRDVTGVGGPEGWLTTPVGIQGGAWGRLVVTSPADAARSRVVAERAAQALELDRMIGRDDSAIRLRVQGGFLLDLLDGRLETEATAAARLSALGLGRPATYVGVVARPRSQPPTDVDAAHRRLVRLSEQVVEALDAPALVGVLDSGHVGVLVDASTGLDRAARALRELVPDAVLGAGHPVTEVLAAAGSLRSARTVVDVAASMPTVDGCVRHEDIRLSGLLMSMSGDARLQGFAEAELGALLEHEARHRDGLVDLLRSFLAVGGNKAELARVAHRNRTSLYATLRRIEDLAGHPLDDPASRLSLGVALLAYDLGRLG